MLALALESSSPFASVALFEAGRLAAYAEQPEPNRSAERLLELVASVFREAGAEPSQLSVILVGVGPGSFTGIRVGIALGRGIACGLSVRIAGVNALRAIAAQAPESDPRPRVVALRANADEVFLGVYSAKGHELFSPGAVANDAALGMVESLLGELPRVCLGDGAELVASFPPETTSTELSPKAAAGPNARAFFVAAFGESTFEPGQREARIEALPPAEPAYVKEPNVRIPILAVSPFQKAES